MDIETPQMSIANIIDHTLLKPDTTKDEMDKLCAEGVEYGFASVCVTPYFVTHCKNQLSESTVQVCTVVGFPLGISSSFAKVEAIKRAISDGADEIDAVINISAVKDGNWNYIRNEIQSFTRATHLKGKLIKLIVEAAMFDSEQLKRICEIANKEEIDFIKTCTGYNGSATPEMVAELKQILIPEIKIKASGGIKTKEAAHKLIAAGASRLGSSNGILLM